MSDHADETLYDAPLLRALCRESGRPDAEPVLDTLLAERQQALTDLQTCLHLLAEDGYLEDPDYPEVDEVLARYEKAVGA